MAVIESRLTRTKERISAAAKASSREPSAIRLVASSRALMVDPVIAAAKLGLKDFSEDFLPEGVTKRPPVDRKVPGLTWHFSGTLPAQKLSLAVEFFDWIHGVDRVSLTRPLADAIRAKNRNGIHLLVEINVLGLKKRTGISPEEAPQLLESLLRIPEATVAGLSFKTELSTSFSDGLWAYRQMAALSNQWIEQGILPSTARELAMGTSRDFEEAIAAGSTLVRIGSGIFGPKVQGSVSEL